jgi:voltage-gated potassium channel Kch
MKLLDLIRFAENKYNRLLTILIVSFLSEPFIGEMIVATSMLYVIFFGVFLWTALLIIKSLEHSKTVLGYYFCLAGVAFCLKILGALDPSSSSIQRIIDASSQAIFLFFVAMSAILILEEVFAVSVVTSDTIKGGICVYFLIGFFWSILYSIVYSFNPTAFSKPMQISDINYFSFTTLTTTGYGDIVPTDPLTRILANLEAISGIMYPTIFIAQLVALYSNQKNN